MNKRRIAICTIALMVVASLVGCNRTTDNQKEEQPPLEEVATVEPVDSVVGQIEAAPAENTNPTVREVLQKGAKTTVDYNFMEEELDINMKYNGADYYIYASQLTDEARNRMENSFSSAAESPIRTLKPTDVKPDVKLSDLIKTN